ncbi:MAG TPA: protein kinase [Blastocatellia bacterium]|jgi:serine/threonine-protein kinase|nr:protein kinase [Blastocatellia bacterium]
MVMTPVRYKQIKSIFQSAVDLPHSEQAIFLDKACSGDEGLRREVENLLSSHGQVEDSIELIASEVAATMLAGPQSGSLIDQQVGAYQIINQIGRGGMGEVYLARDTRLGRQVALKLLPPRFTEDARRVQRFRQEARAASALNHPNIMTIHEIGEVETAVGALHFIATEFIEGRTLRELIRDGRMSLGEALEVAMQVASALSAAHAAGIVHRDIKPENIMLRPDGYVKVLDFGLAKLGLESGELGIGNRESGIREQVACPHSPFPTPHSLVSTDPGMVLGTVSYMSPEQARGLETDARSDIFSLGIVLYEMITSRRPFEGETPSDVIVALLNQEPPFAEHAPDLPGELRRLVSRMLAKDCAGRHQTADEARRALKRLKQCLTPAGDFKTREFSGLASLARRFGRAGASEDYKTVLTTTREPRPSKSSAFFAGRFTRSPLRVSLALMALAALIAAAILGLQWLNRRDSHIDSIAVLPFKPLVADARDEALEMGIADTLITRLSRLQKITVRPFSAVRRFTALDQDPVAAGRQLQTQAVLEGNIQKVGDKIRVTARLIDVGRGRTIWTQQFDERWGDIFAIQDAISQRVADDLIVTLTGEERIELAKNYTADPEAYRLYVDGSYQWNKRTPEGIRNGLEAFRKAAEKDHGYALAYVGVANAYITLGTYHLAAPKEALPLAREAAAQALNIDESLAEAHTAMGKIISDYYWDWPLAEKEFRRALKLKPNYPILHDWYSAFLAYMGRFDEAIREAELELELDPLSPIAHTRLGIALYLARRYDQAIPVLQKTISQAPNYTPARLFLGLCYSIQGRREEALAEFQNGQAIAPKNSDFISLLGNVSALAGRRDDARRYQEQLNELAKRAYVSPFAQATISAGLGDNDAAFMWMEKCFEERCSALATLKTDPRFDVFRQDTRFELLMRRVGFAQ